MLLSVKRHREANIYSVSAVNGYSANHSANGWVILGPTSVGDAMDLSLGLNFRASGIINLPLYSGDEACNNWVCHQIDETSKNYPWS